jgi:hypothetical protein
MANINACMSRAGALGEVWIATLGLITLRYPDITWNSIDRGRLLLYAILAVETGLI